MTNCSFRKIPPALNRMRCCLETTETNVTTVSCIVKQRSLLASLFASVMLTEV